MPRLTLRKLTETEEQALAGFVSPASLTLMVDSAGIPRLAISLHPTARRHAPAVAVRLAFDQNDGEIPDLIMETFAVVREVLRREGIRHVVVGNIAPQFIGLCKALGFKRDRAGYVAKV